MSAGSQIDWGTNVPIYDPDGQLHAIPQDPGMIKAALAEPGAKRAIPVLAPTGEHHWIPEDQMHDALGAGGKIDFPTHDIAKWYGFTPSNVLSNAWQNFKGFYTGAKDIAADLAANPNWISGTPERPSTLEKFVERPMEHEVVRAGQELEKGNVAAAAGHGLASGVPLVGPWAAGLGEQAGTGDVGGAAGGAAGVYGAIKAPGLVRAAASEVLPARARAQAGLDRVATDAATRTPDYTKTTKLIDAEVQKASATGRPDLPDQALALYSRGLASGAGEATPATFPELYDHLKAINEALYVDRSVPKSQIPATKAIAQSLANDLSAATKEMPRGYSRLWDQSLSEYHHAMQMTRAANIAGPIIGGAVGFGLGRHIGRAIEAPLAGELAAGYAGRTFGKPLAGSIARSITGREMPPVPPDAPLPQGAMWNIGQGINRVRNFMTGGPPAPPTSAAPPPPPGAPPPVTPTPQSGPPAPPTGAVYNMNDPAARAASDLAFQQQYPKGVVPGAPMDPLAQKAWDQSVGFAKPEEAGGRDVGSKAREANPEPTRAQTKGKGKIPPPPPVETPHTRLRAEVANDPLTTHGNEQSTYVPFVKEGKLIGSGWLDARPDIGEGVAEVSRSDIAKVQQGTGQAKGLYQTLYDEAIRRGFTRVVSDSVQSNEAVRAWDGMVKRGLAKEITDPYGGKRYEYTGAPPPPPPPKPIARNLPPEAALRFILEAKNGDISPGELARRYAKYGLSSEVRRLERG